VDIVLITAPASVGLHGKYAIAAARVYRSISRKVLITAVWLIYHHIVGPSHSPISLDFDQ
jgi:hypothetical protein